MANHVAIAGGGLAGLACAKTLVDAGYRVSLFEGMPYFGGRASTYRDADGDWIEQGLHLFLGTYSALKELLRGVGVDPDAVLFWTTRIHLEDPHGRTATYGLNPITRPLQTLLSVLGQNSFLDPLDKLSLTAIATPSLFSMDTLRRDYDGTSVSEWWARLGGTPNVMERVLRPFCRAIQFTDADEFSAYNLLGWIHHVLRDLPHAYLGGYRGARDEIFFQPLARYLRRAGASLHTRAPLGEIRFDPDANRITGFRLEDGSEVEADTYVVAVPAWAFVPLMPHALRAMPFFRAIADLPVAPAISVQLWFDRPVVRDEAFHLLARSVTPVYQDQAKNAYPYPRGSRLSIVLAPADSYLHLPDADLAALAVENLAAVQPAARHATLVKSLVLKHTQHLIRPLPGAMAARPRQRTPVANLFLAGDWTQQDYFGSQEGAVRGGLACAQAILRS